MRSSTVNGRIQELDIAEGLKQLLTDAALTIELIVRLDYQEISEMLNIDPYVGKLTRPSRDSQTVTLPQQ